MSSREIDEIKRIACSGMGRGNADRLADLLEQRPDLFDVMTDLFFTEEEPVSRRVVWAIDLYTESHPEALLPLLEPLAQALSRFRHPAMIRHSLRMLSRSPLPAENLGMLISFCFDRLLFTKDPPAVKVHAMEILYRATRQEPGLRQELIDTIEWRFSEESAGVRCRGEKILKRLYRDIG